MNQLKLPKYHFKFDLHRYINIAQVGCGGTGSLLVPLLSRLIASHNENEQPRQPYGISYTIVDGDKVEKKNIIRQNFISCDIGKFKSDVLAKRYSLAFGIEIQSASVYIKTLDDLNKICKESVEIIIGCVDNHLTRRLICEWVGKREDYNRPLLIDAGNEEKSGQIFIQGETNSPSAKSPKLLEIHPEIAQAKDEVNQNRSCAERVTTGEQALSVNSTAANLIYNIIESFLRDNPIHYYEVTFSSHNSFQKKLLAPPV
jgi:PRTRC genetic system ThiF family protein